MNTDRLCMKCMQEGVRNGRCTLCKEPVMHQQTPDHALPLQTILHGRYLVGATLGAGGFGITYIALDLEKQKRVAIKELLPQGYFQRSSGTSYVNSDQNKESFQYIKQQFIREANIIHRLKTYPHIVHVEKCFEQNGTAYYVMEYLKGCDLSKHLKKNSKPLTFTQTIDLLLPVLKDLTQIHKQGIIHRDISPVNIFVCEDQTIKLIDFGAAHQAYGEKSQSYDVIVKRGYAPVEQYQRKGKQGAWTDLYAIGATIYRCITGKVPLDATTRTDGKTLEKPSSLGATISKKQEKVLLKAMALHHNDRYASIEEMLDALKEPKPFVPETKTDTNTPSIPSKPSKTAPAPPHVKSKRVVASLIDSVLHSLCFFVVFTLLSANDPDVAWGMGSLASFLFGCWQISMEGSTKQASLGKQWVGLRVSTEEGKPLTLAESWRRYLVKGLCAFIFLIDGLVFLCNKQGRSLHCKWTKTKVDTVAPSKTIAENEPADPNPKTMLDPDPPQDTMTLLCTEGQYESVSFPLKDQVIILGRNPEKCNIIFHPQTKGVSNIHCSVAVENDAVLLKDVGSTYGTTTFRKTLHQGESTHLHRGDYFSIGSETFVVQ